VIGIRGATPKLNTPLLEENRSLRMSRAIERPLSWETFHGQASVSFLDFLSEEYIGEYVCFSLFLSLEPISPTHLSTFHRSPHNIQHMQAAAITRFEFAAI